MAPVKMRYCTFIYPLIITGIALLCSCRALEKASLHGFNSGYYTLEYEKTKKPVYVDVTEDKVDVYNKINKKPDKEVHLSIPINNPDTLAISPLIFRKQSLDIDIASILLKYRSSVYDLPPQLNTELNFAIYAGWRHDSYKISTITDPLNKRHLKLTNFGYDFGFFAGPGTTNINPFTTNNRTTNEYSGMVLQTGFAGFLESNIVSFGVAVGLDYLLNDDKDIWIYHKKPWIGFVVGIALN